MPWRGLITTRALGRTRRVRSGALRLEHYHSSNSLSSAQINEDQPSPPNTLPRKDVPLARHADLLATAGTKDDVTGIELKIAGLVRSIRKQKKVAFAHISDGSTLQPVQAILTPELAGDITNGSYVEVVGTWASSPASGQTNELQVTAVNRIGETNPDEFPIQKKSMSADFLRTVPHLRFRTPYHALIARSRSRLIKYATHYYNYVRLNEAYQVHPPLITSSDCEGAGEVFTITPKTGVSSASLQKKDPQLGKDEPKHYFRDPKYLTVSSQLHLEAYSAELGDVWTLSPTFRAEESETPRHLSEFYMLEAEFRSITSLQKLMQEVEDLIRYLVTSFRADTVSHQLLAYHADPKHQPENAEQRISDLEERWHKIDSRPWTTITYTDAISALKSNPNSSFTFPPTYESGLQLEHERWLVQHVGNNSPVFVTHYPKHIKPFYMLPSNMASDTTSHPPPPSTANNTPTDSEIDTVACFDLLFPHGTAEVVGGSLREHRLPELIASMKAKGLVRRSPTAAQLISNTTYPHLSPGESLGSLQWYADLRRYGSSPHGGFGLGFDRLLAYLTGTASIRDTVGFPRWFGRADC